MYRIMNSYILCNYNTHKKEKHMDIIFICMKEITIIKEILSHLNIIEVLSGFCNFKSYCLATNSLGSNRNGYK